MNDDVKVIVSAGYAEHVRDVAMSKLLQEEELENLRYQLEPKGINYGDKIKVSPSADAIPDGVAEIEALKAVYRDKVAEYASIIAEAHDALLNIDVVPRTALTKHYILLYTWEETCIDMGYSYDGIMKVRRRGLLQLYDFIPAEYRDVLPKAIIDRDIAWPTEEDAEKAELTVRVNGETLA